MGFRRNLTAALVATSLILGTDATLGQNSLQSILQDSTVEYRDSIVIDIPLDNSLGFYIFDDYVKTCWKTKKILAVNGRDTTYSCKDSVLAERNMKLAEDLLDNDITRWVVTYTMIGLELMQDSVRNSPDSTFKLNARYNLIYKGLLQKYPFLEEVLLRDDSLDGVY